MTVRRGHSVSDALQSASSSRPSFHRVYEHKDVSGRFLPASATSIMVLRNHRPCDALPVYQEVQVPGHPQDKIPSPLCNHLAPGSRDNQITGQFPCGLCENHVREMPSGLSSQHHVRIISGELFSMLFSLAECQHKSCFNEQKGRILKKPS